MLTDLTALTAGRTSEIVIVNCRSVTPAGAGHGCGSCSSFDHSRILSHVSFTSLKISIFLFKIRYRQNEFNKTNQYSQN